MPVLHRYADRDGVYLRSNVEGAFVTLQVADAAATFLEQRGYADGDDVGWQLIHPLMEHGYVYTGENGVTVEDVEPEVGEGIDVPSSDRDALDAFLQREAEGTVPDDVVGLLDRIGIATSATEAATFLDGVGDQEWAVKSLRQMGQHHPIVVRDVDVAPSGDLVYYCRTKDVEWACYDGRWRSPPQLTFVIEPYGDRQFLDVQERELGPWTTDSGNAPFEVAATFTEVLPDVFWYCAMLPGFDARFDEWSLSGGVHSTLAKSRRRSLDRRLSRLRQAYTEEWAAETATGIVVDHVSDGWGRIRVDDVEITLPYDTSDVGGVTAKPGARVAFDVTQTPHGPRAVAIRDPTTSNRRVGEFGTRRAGDGGAGGNGNDGVDEDDPESEFDAEKRHDEAVALLEAWGVEQPVGVLQGLRVAGGNVEAIVDSIHAFDALDADVVGFDFAEGGDPEYQIDGDETWVVTHHLSEGPADFTLEVTPSDGPSQITTVSDGRFDDWTTVSADADFHDTLLSKVPLVDVAAGFVHTVTEGMSRSDGDGTRGTYNRLEQNPE